VLAAYETQLLEKEHSGCAVLLRDDKTEDLGRGLHSSTFQLNLSRF
jgi:hypothetical protein